MSSSPGTNFPPLGRKRRENSIWKSNSFTRYNLPTGWGAIGSWLASNAFSTVLFFLIPCLSSGSIIPRVKVGGMRNFLSLSLFFPSPRLVVRGRIEAGDCEAGVDRGDRPGVSSGWGGDLPRNRSTCSWHQKLALTTSNNSSKPSSPPRRPLDTPFKLQGPERRIDRCTHAPLVSTVVLNMWSASRSCSLCSVAKIKGGNREGIIAVPRGKNSELFAEQPAPFIFGSCSP